MRKRYSDGGWIVLPVCKPSATAPPGGRPGLWRVAEHARSGARADLMMSLPVAECSNGLRPIAIARSDRMPSSPRDLSNRLRTLRAPTRITTPQTLADSYAVSDVLTHHILDPETGTDFDAECDLAAEVNRSRAGLRPISARNSTDLGEGGERSAPDACSVGAPHEERARIHTRSQAACGRDQFAVDLDRCRVGEPNDRFGAAAQSHASQRAGGVGVGGGEGR